MDDDNSGGDENAANARQTIEARFRALSPLGHSLLRRLPANRTCADVGVPNEYCACAREREIDVNAPIVKRAALALVTHVNTLLESATSAMPTLMAATTKTATSAAATHSSNETHRTQRCARLELDSVRSARVELPRDARLLHGRAQRTHAAFARSATSFFLDRAGGSGGGERAIASSARGAFLNYGLTVRVRPSDALLDASARHFLADDRLEIFGDVSRINRYGNQSACVNDAILRKFCFCTSV